MAFTDEEIAEPDCMRKDVGPSKIGPFNWSAAWPPSLGRPRPVKDCRIGLCISSFLLTPYISAKRFVDYNFKYQSILRYIILEKK
jgi:hypothetical protein